MVSSLINVSTELANAVAEGLGMARVPPAMPTATQRKVLAEVDVSPALSLFARPGDGKIAARRIAILVADEVVGAQLLALHSGLTERGAVPRFVGVRLGPVQTSDGGRIEVDATLETSPGVLFDAVILPDGAGAVDKLRDGHAMEFIRDQFRHCKTILALGAGADLLNRAGAQPADVDGGVLRAGEAEDHAATLSAFVVAIAKHRHFERDTDPPAA